VEVAYFNSLPPAAVSRKARLSFKIVNVRHNAEKGVMGSVLLQLLEQIYGVSAQRKKEK